MGKSLDSPGRRLRALWQRLAPLPGGRWLFSRALTQMVPYSGSVAPLVLALEPGHAKVRIPDRRKNRNHLNSMHAVALVNAAEMASGLAMLTGLPDTARGIVRAISIEYLKKARGALTAESRCIMPDVSIEAEHDFLSTVTDEAGDVVARATVRWRLGPRP